MRASKWVETPLEDLCEISGGTTPSKANESYWNGNIPWITPTDLKYHRDGISIINSSRQQITDEARKKHNLKIVPQNSVIFSSRATIGKIGITEIPITTNQGFVNFIPSNRILPKFLAFFLLYEIDNIEKLSGSTTFKEVSRTSLRKFKIPLPHIEEQHKIVSILDEIDDLRQKQRKAIELTRQMIPSLFYEMLNDQSCTLQKLEKISLFEYGLTATAQDQGNARFLRITDILDTGLLSSQDQKFIDLDPQNSKFLLHSGDVLVARTGATYGKTLLFEENSTAVFASYLIRLHLDKQVILPPFYWIFAQTEEYWQQARSLVTGTGQPQFNANVIKNIQVPTPSLEIQKKLAEKLGEILILLRDQSKSLKSLDTLFEVTLNHFFSLSN